MCIYGRARVAKSSIDPEIPKDLKCLFSDGATCHGPCCFVEVRAGSVERSRGGATVTPDRRGPRFGSVGPALTRFPGRLKSPAPTGLTGARMLLGIANSANGPPQVATDTRIIGMRPVTAPADDTHLAEGQQLCHYGLITGPQHGGPECGPITDVGPAKVKFLADVEKGDSGGPVYYRNADGTATPVGITIRAADADDGTVAELIGPWLEHWNLSVDSS
jgi:hypothetical protein